MIAIWFVLAVTIAGVGGFASGWFWRNADVLDTWLVDQIAAAQRRVDARARRG